jgi:hypothetical protein
MNFKVWLSDSELDDCGSSVQLSRNAVGLVGKSKDYRPLTLERHAVGEAHVVPVIVRACERQSTPLGKLRAVPRC